jgi:hypothetical protein
MYENGKMIPVETIPGMGGGRIKENDGILSEVSLAQKTKNRMFSLICGH